MLNDVHEPPLEPELAEQLKANKKSAALTHPVLAPDGDPIADVELFHSSIPEHTLTGGLAMAMFAGILLIVFAIVFWVWH